MIATFFFTIINSLLNLIIQNSPEGHLPIIIFTSVTYFWSALNTFTMINPVSTMIQAVVVIMVYELARLFLEFVLPWVLTKIPFINIK